MLFDTHAHLDDQKYNEDRDEVISSLPQYGVKYFVNIGDSIETSRNSIKIADKYDFAYATVGVHPHFAKEFTDVDIDILRSLAKNTKVVAIGEIGLDYHYDEDFKEEQFNCFRKQMNLAEELNLPVVIHNREATQDTLEILKEFLNVKGIVHSYSGSAETAKILTDMGYYLSFNGITTFKNAHRVKEVLLSVDRNRVLIETDSPYLTPEPHRGKRNSPAFVGFVAQTIADLWGESREYVEDITLRNGLNVYRINKENI